jgi:D-serine deaminase-like pyridoxal phosphate-dependent protein
VPTLRLVGVEAFEGTLSVCVTTPEPDQIEYPPGDVAPFLSTVNGALEALIGAGHLDSSNEILISAGGSAFFDHVVDTFAKARHRIPRLRLVLRSGCYLTHDSGFYETTSPMGSRAQPGAPKLEPALELWSVVLSRPEPGLVILGAGKRDLPVDLGLPRPTRTWSSERRHSSIEPGTATVCGVSDQHLHVQIDTELPLDVGDLCACAISHPCTAFDKWRVIPIVDDDLTIIDAVRTYF